MILRDVILISGLIITITDLIMNHDQEIIYFWQHLNMIVDNGDEPLMVISVITLYEPENISNVVQTTSQIGEFL